MIKFGLLAALSGVAMGASNYFVNNWGSELMAFATYDGNCQPASIATTRMTNYVCIDDTHIEEVIFDGTECVDSALQCVCEYCDYTAPDGVDDACTIYSRDEDDEYPDVAEQYDFRCDADDDYVIIEAGLSSCDSSVEVASAVDVCFSTGFDVEDGGTYYLLQQQLVFCNATFGAMSYYMDAYNLTCNDLTKAATYGVDQDGDDGECQILVEDYKGGDDIYAQQIFCSTAAVLPDTTEDDGDEDSSLVLSVVSAFSLVLFAFLAV